MTTSGCPQKLQVQTRAMEDHPDVGVVYGQSLVRRGDYEFLRPYPSIARSGFVFRPLLMMCFCAHPPGLLIRRDVFAKVGGFDKQLRTNEDYYLWLRIAFHFPFLFVIVAVPVRNESADGLYYSTMARGGGARDARAVIERGLRMLPEGRRYDALGREARLRTELHIALHGTHFAARDERWHKVPDALRGQPEILHYRCGRGPIAMNASAQIIHSDASMETGWNVSIQLAEAVSGRGVGGSRAPLALWRFTERSGCGGGSRAGGRLRPLKASEEGRVVVSRSNASPVISLLHAEAASAAHMT
jgi:hypothetical protein